MAALKPSVSTPMPRALQRVLRQIEREAEGVVKLESDFARQFVAGCSGSGGFVEQFQPARQRFAEARFFQLQCFGDQRFGALQFRIGLPISATSVGTRRYISGSFEPIRWA